MPSLATLPVAGQAGEPDISSSKKTRSAVLLPFPSVHVGVQGACPRLRGNRASHPAITFVAPPAAEVTIGLAAKHSSRRECKGLALPPGSVSRVSRAESASNLPRGWD